MKYGDPVHKVLRLLESENINPGNLLIGQTVDVKVIDARKAEFLRPMVVGEFYPDGSVLLKDELTQETIVLQFQWDTNTNGLLYTGESDFGVKYELEINRDLMSNESITKLTESRKLNEREITGSGRINYDDDLVRVYKDGKEIYSGLEDDEPMNRENWKYDSSTKSYKLSGGYVKILV